MGGPSLTPQNETLGRIWENDRKYLHVNSSAVNVSVNPSTITYPMSVTPEIAPNWVYASAETMGDANVPIVNFNQRYVGFAPFNYGTANSSTSVLGYFCDVVNPTCQSYLIYRSQPPYYNIVSSISKLFNSDPSQLAQINSVSENENFETNKEVIVPVNCSCSGQFSQANTNYSIRQGDQFSKITNDTLQGLSTSQATQNQNPNVSTLNLNIGQMITIPLRCACPIKNQSDASIKYLLSYTIAQGDSLSAISGQFQVYSMDILAANELSDPPTIYPFTTLLVQNS
ncbi:lysM domain receptor-like kinase 4 [Telopea speciosissima]|uniref:lysM domain receptor-like kinase 4 n=1 Tax=Telopea speciosissima TaxID=54955 RepID=UPI001CC5B847|nr:lysM domain receptor-like kinase 4 [Telopea speciosissima]